MHCKLRYLLILYKTEVFFRFCQVEDRFSASYSSGQSLLTKINSTLGNMEESLLCFDTAKSEAQNASHTAEMAFNISKKAKEVSCLVDDLYSHNYSYNIRLCSCCVSAKKRPSIYKPKGESQHEMLI